MPPPGYKMVRPLDCIVGLNKTSCTSKTGYNVIFSNHDLFQSNIKIVRLIKVKIIHGYGHNHDNGEFLFQSLSN